ncbi:M20 family peptidase [Variovorax sp. J22P240]|uniref:M20 family peptidase n=1 Tax=unclassified Variovorax TaxID=663243 RepID=UPI0025784004|nr:MULTISPECIES: M20 family peptidase [unclassified Variovorax]MDL9997651.1 M20 family peptidase [Variovorax sp. J22P240]MDM0051688.1 M20 family peptidase [Variovorax sp. J22R115]
MLKRVSLALLLVLLALVAAVAVNTWRTPSRQLAVAPAPALPIDKEAAAKRLSGAIQFRTVSSLEDPAANNVEFDKLHAYLAQQFPKVHATLKKEVVGQKALLYTWAGSDPAAKPVALMAHQDMVPIASGTEKAWSVDPFAGEIKDGFVWGRGTLDNKGNLMAQMEAIEMLIGSGFQPEQTVYLVMGDDEEVSGLRGALPIAELLKSRGVRLDWVLDEGLLVLDGVLPGLSKPAALIGLAEKGYGTFFLSLDTAPGHSSMPPAHSAIGTMSAALARLEATPMPGGIQGVAGEMFGTLAPEMSGINRVMLSNLWLTRPLVESQLQKSPSSNAMLRTTTALTIVRAGNKDNVLPGRIEAAVNFRILPGDTIDSVEAHLKRALGNDAIQVKRYPGNSEPSPVSPTNSTGYRSIEQAVRQVFPDALVAPGLMTAATDSRHFSIVSDAVYRFSPFRVKSEDLPRFHGTNERVSISNYAEMIQFYHQLLRNTAQPQ